MSKRRTCPACGKGYTLGTRVFFAARTGGRWATVCGSCARNGVTIVQDRSGNFSKCIHCDVRDAVLCALCAVRGAGKVHATQLSGGEFVDLASHDPSKIRTRGS